MYSSILLLPALGMLAAADSIQGYINGICSGPREYSISPIPEGEFFDTYQGNAIAFTLEKDDGFEYYLYPGPDSSGTETMVLGGCVALPTGDGAPRFLQKVADTGKEPEGKRTESAEAFPGIEERQSRKVLGLSRAGATVVSWTLGPMRDSLGRALQEVANRAPDKEDQNYEGWTFTLSGITTVVSIPRSVANVAGEICETVSVGVSWLMGGGGPYQRGDIAVVDTNDNILALVTYIREDSGSGRASGEEDEGVKKVRAVRNRFSKRQFPNVPTC